MLQPLLLLLLLLLPLPPPPPPPFLPPRRAPRGRGGERASSRPRENKRPPHLASNHHTSGLELPQCLAARGASASAPPPAGPAAQPAAREMRSTAVHLRPSCFSFLLRKREEKYTVFFFLKQAFISLKKVTLATILIKYYSNILIIIYRSIQLLTVFTPKPRCHPTTSSIKCPGIFNVREFCRPVALAGSGVESPSWLTATSASCVQAILLPQPRKT
uniref:uncharacterized protein LOC128928186 n=1 Tax=Callithrix jacchus TaxID=9483 RepID=UPI0023DCF16D|nr:uncharacterized protein LOC128928186 [Callithrix jacchus]